MLQVINFNIFFCYLPLIVNYNTSMMKEHFHPPRNLEDVNRILENCKL